MRDLVLGVIIFGLLPLCLKRPWIGILVWYWFGIMNPHRHTFRWAYDFQWAMLIGGATLLGVVFAKDRKPIPWNTPLVLTLVLMAYFTLTSVFAWAPHPAWMQWNKVAKILLMTVIATMFIYNKERIRALLMVIAFSIGFYGVKGAIFVVTSGGAERVQGPEGSFIEGNTFVGLAMNMVLPLMIYLARDEERPWLRRTLYIMAGMTVVSIIFTYSRGAWLGLAAVIPFIFWNFKRKWLALAVLVPVLVIVPSVLPEKVSDRAETIRGYEKDGSANKRLQSWAVAINVARDYPFTGAGFEFEYAGNDRWLKYGVDEYAWAQTHSSAAHSIYFQMLGQHGFVALVLYLFLLFSTQVALQRAKTRARIVPGMGWLANASTALQIGLVGYMVSGAFLSSAYFDLAWLFYALSAIFAREVKAAATSAGRIGAPARSVPAPALGSVREAR